MYNLIWNEGPGLQGGAQFKEKEYMTTKREYLKTKGITVGLRGRFSGAAKQAISEAEKNGMKFTAETPKSSK